MDHEFDLEEKAPADLERPARRLEPSHISKPAAWIVALLVMLVLVALVLPAVRAAREAARRAQCSCNLCGLKLAIHNYHETYGVLPPAYVADANGRPMHSWRVLILPFLEQATFYKQYDFSEPWDGPNNIKLLDHMPNYYACPSRSSGPTNLTSYTVISGQGTMFPGSKSAKFADVTDGLANTLMVVEVADVKIPWTAPVDLDIGTMSLRVNDPIRPGISSPHPGGANTAFGDGKYVFLREDIPEETLRALITVAGGEAVDADEVLHLK